MRQITKQSTNAFFNKGKLNKQNMLVFYDRYDQTSRMLLHGNCIATYDHDNKRKIKRFAECQYISKGF